MSNALICFVKYPRPKQVKTRLGEVLGYEIAAEIYRTLAERVLTEIFPAALAYDLRVYIDTSDPLSAYEAWLGSSWQFYDQTNGDLGHRMRSAIQETMEAGYSKVAIIGSDCVFMDEAFIVEAFSKLDEYPIVVGPSTDGGYYLLAVSEDYPFLFENMAWSTSDVLDDTLNRLEDRDMKVFQLEQRLDIDTPEDLMAFREGLPPENYLGKKIDQLVLEKLEYPHGLPSET